MNLNINKFKKDKYHTDTKSTKYFLSKCQTNIDNAVNKNTKDFLIINRILKNPSVFSGVFENNENVVLKINENEDKTKKEFEISEYLYEKGYDNFVKFICKFSCMDNLSKYSQIDSNIYVCDVDGKVKISALLMKEYPLGSIRNYSWTKGNIYILKDLLTQTLTILFDVSKETGFIHKDFHADNIMISKNFFGNFIPIIIDLEMSLFVNNKEIHKDYIYREIPKNLEKILATYDLKKLFASLLDLPNSNVRLDVSDILKKIRKIEDSFEETTFDSLYEIFSLIDNIEIY